MEALDCVSEVSTLWRKTLANYRDSCAIEDFALMEASCAIIRILQEFPDISLPTGYPVVPTGQEKQELTVFLKSAEGCKVILK